jgi:hypothetical protein
MFLADTIFLGYIGGLFQIVGFCARVLLGNKACCVLGGWG